MPEEMNMIEMQSITALARLQSCVLYFMDLIEQWLYGGNASTCGPFVDILVSDVTPIIV